ncbi:receptor-like protein kinase HSL1 [Beta vulgaris subsp. vulgaris]|uniref:receptor-like protein kinase HSL1 n=1 Tax=Beta vulgaris subsp. vulgaris TaxID=3555 RepID=UPI00254912BC|nr:receptor-like protein kinase HSL1 [Beta vulgaris subsp. vulgaris]
MLNLPFSSIKILLSFFTLLLTCKPFLVSPLSQNSEQAILLMIKQQWGNISPMQSWNSTTAICHWPGINCTGGESVTGIALNSHNIKGEIPPFICDLENLTLLDLGNNSIQGNFPTFLYNCTKLQTLILSSNYFVGLLPNDISRLSPKLRHLDLSANNFTGDIPTSLAQLKGLITLRLESNVFNDTYPYDLGNLENLEELGLAYNPFSPANLPKEFGTLKNLKFLWMTQCNLTGIIPENLANLTNLEHLDLASNDLVGGIPRGLFMLKNLTYVYLYRNRLSGGIPSSIEAINLVEIDLSMNNLRGIIPDTFGNLLKLEILHLYHNTFHGLLPPSIGLLPSLKQLKLFNNQFSGPLPPEMGLHSKLEGFEVSDNAFTGQLPRNLCAGGSLVGVVAFSNYLNGTIPSSLGQCTTLLVILLSNNHFSGVLPPKLGFLSQLISFDVSINQFSGVIPLSLSKLNALQTLSVHRNNFSGGIPSGLLMLPNILFLFLSNNSFSGKFPSQLSEKLIWLDIRHNKFSGPIPSSIASWENLVEFRASNNQFWGNIPVELTALSSLHVLLLDGNQLSGELPSRIISWKSLDTLNLAQNNLSGPLPAALGTLPRLNSLNLSNNKLSGQIPSDLARLIAGQNLITLNLSSNSFSGKIPNAFHNSEFNQSFLDNANLCSDKQISDLHRCSSSRNKYLPLILVPGAIFFLTFLYFAFFRSSKGTQHENSSEHQVWELKPFHRVDFTGTMIVSGLTDDNMIGSGGSGKVYSIIVNDSDEKVAVKRIWSGKKIEGALEKQFLTEVEILGTIRHANIVKLLRCVSNAHVKLLVYEYMENESLDKWLHMKKRDNEPSSMHSGTSMSNPDENIVLVWPTRLRIAVGAAKGLCYLHNDCCPPVIHRDVKSSNILLDSEFNAKIADFGLAKMTDKTGEPYTASAVAGSFGYIAPEYWQTKRLNEKIDVYSFGVVLLELATGKDPCTGNEHLNLADWSWQHCFEEHPIIDALDEHIKEPRFIEQMVKVFKLGLICTSKMPSSRPSMKQVLQLLNACSHYEG